MNWKLTLPHGTKLREAIKDGDSVTVMDILLDAYRWLDTELNMDLSSYVKDITVEIECEAFDAETVNYYLDEFYSFCDVQKVWVEL